MLTLKRGRMVELSIPLKIQHVETAVNDQPPAREIGEGTFIRRVPLIGLSR